MTTASSSTVNAYKKSQCRNCTLYFGTFDACQHDISISESPRKGVNKAIVFTKVDLKTIFKCMANDYFRQLRKIDDDHLKRLQEELILS